MSKIRSVHSRKRAEDLILEVIQRRGTASLPLLIADGQRRGISPTAMRASIEYLLRIHFLRLTADSQYRFGRG